LNEEAVNAIARSIKKVLQNYVGRTECCIQENEKSNKLVIAKVELKRCVRNQTRFSNS